MDEDDSGEMASGITCIANELFEIRRSLRDIEHLFQQFIDLQLKLNGVID